MFKTYVLLAFRNLLKHKLFSAINIIGLAIGISCAVWYLLVSLHFLSYDSHYPKKDNTFAVVREVNRNDTVFDNIYMTVPLAPYLEDKIPGIEVASRIRQGWQGNFSSGGVKSLVDSISIVDSNFFEIYQPTFIWGDGKAFNQFRKVILTEYWAHKFFGTTQCEGRSLLWGPDTLEICGVVEDVPKASGHRYSLLISESSADFDSPDEWLEIEVIVSVLVDESYPIETIEKTMTDSLMRILDSAFVEVRKRSLEDILEDRISVKYKLVNIQDLFLTIDVYFVGASMLKLGYLIGLVVASVVLLACINYVNLASANAVQRYREMAVRKIMGATQINILLQVLIESVILVFVATFFALILHELFAPFIALGSYVPDIREIFQWEALLSLACFVVFIGILAGVYPALSFCRRKILELVSGRFKLNRGQKVTKRILVTIQLISTGFLIIFAYIFNSQYQYFVNFETNVNASNLVEIQNLYDLQDDKPQFKKEILSHPNVKNACYFSQTLHSANSEWMLHFANDPEDEQKFALIMHSERDVVDVLGLEFLHGSMPSEEELKQQKAIVFNETALKWFKMDSTIVGQMIDFPDTFSVAGVLKDFHYMPLQQPIFSLAIVLGEEHNYGTLALSVDTTDIKGLRSFVQTKLDEYIPYQAYKENHLNEAWDKRYSSEEKFRSFIILFATITILLASMGLLGLTIHFAGVRTKEIGIRKIHGATDLQIIQLLLKETSVLLAISWLVSIPMAYIIVNEGLQLYANRVTISWHHLLVPATSMTVFILIVEILVIWQIANKKPAESLRSEQ